MLDKVGKYEFLAEPFHCDFSKRLFMGHLEIIRTLHHVHTDLGVCCRRSEIAAVLKERDNKARKLY